MRAEALGEAKFVMSAGDGSGSVDAVQLSIPVMGQQEAVAIAKSFAIRAAPNGTSNATVGLDLPAAVPGTGGVELQAGVGRLPAVLSAAREIMESGVNHTCPIDGDLELAHAGVPAVLQSYGLFTTAQGDQQSKGTARALLASSGANFSLALQNLAVGNLTDAKLGLRWRLGCRKERQLLARPASSSVHLNAYGVWLVETLGDRLESTDRKVLVEGAEALKNLSSGIWRPALEAQLLREARSTRQNSGRPIQSSTVALARLALGIDWSPPEDTPATISEDLSVARLEAEFGELSTDAMAQMALAQLRSGNATAREAALEAVKVFTSRLRTGGRTAYVAACDGCAEPASLMGNALALLSMTRAGKSAGPLREKLANYVASPPAGQFAFFPNYIEKLVGMVALAEYDLDRGSADPELELMVRSGNLTLLQANFTSPQSPTISAATPWSALGSTPAPLEFSAQGQGEVTVAALLNFVPLEPLRFPTFRGIQVEAVVQMAGPSAEEGGPVGPPLEVAPLGTVVVVTVQITTPDALDATTVRVLMPGGLEPVDPNVEGDRSAACATPLDTFLSLATFPFENCPEQETLPDAVTFRYDSLRPGIHRAQFRAVAASPGNFSLPSAGAFVNSQPEVMGLSASGRFEVCGGGEGCNARNRSPAPPAKTCPRDCSGNGLCNLESGECLCFEGFEGNDCSNFADV
ncbi:unnamed protein product [Ostreobium quekettii]|uniref:EGF-like domain-containing protein n=1 Tax=Ostreobium quekettii TaxID=121088 RepID=A0A8S1IRD3_9CHLO|nr:unnamed protein product [Ostreobium quekettii]